MREMSNKQRILTLLEYFFQNTDADHPVTIPELIDALGYTNWEAGRKTIRADVKDLKEFGIDIASKTTDRTYYWYDQRLFERSELKMLIDAVSSASFLTKHRSKELTEKILKLASVPEAKTITQSIYTAERIKGNNRSIYNSVETIVETADRKSKASFQYFDFDRNKKKVLKKNGARYLVSPYALIWNDSKYYMVAFSDEHKEIRTYRVDHMCDVQLENAPAERIPKEFKLDSYIQRTFKMFQGDPVEVTLECEEKVMRSVIDHFGISVDTWPNPETDDTFFAKVVVADAPTFLAWVFQSAGAVRIVEPESVVEEYREMLNKTLERI